MKNPIYNRRQRGPADALAELLTEHPELPEAIWTVDLSGYLSGHMHGPACGGFEGLTEYAEVIGGGIRPTHTYTLHDTTFRVHELRAVWRDVVVLVSVGIAETADLAVAS